MLGGYLRLPSSNDELPGDLRPTLRSNSMNCEVCGVACANNEVCTTGTCDCRSGTKRCGNACVDTGVNSVNCGACGVVCRRQRVHGWQLQRSN